MMASSMFTFIVFVCSALLIAVQLASTQLTPRIIGFVFRDPVTKIALTIFVFVFTFSQAVLVRINTEVPTLSAWLAAYSCIACLGVFLFLIDHVGKWLRPSGALRAVALLGREVIEKVYPRRLAELPKTSRDAAVVLEGRRCGRCRASEMASCSPSTSRAWCPWPSVPIASSRWCPRSAISWRPGILCSGSIQGGASLAADDLRHSVAVGQERTMEQDPALGFPHHRGHRLRRDFHRQSMTRRPRSSPSTRSITFSATSAAGIWTMNGCEMRRAGFGSYTEPRLGRILSIGGHGDPPFRRREHPGCAALAGHAGEPDPDFARAASPRLRQELACCTDPPNAFFRSRRTGPWPKLAISREWAASAGKVPRAGNPAWRNPHDGGVHSGFCASMNGRAGANHPANRRGAA